MGAKQPTPSPNAPEIARRIEEKKRRIAAGEDPDSITFPPLPYGGVYPPPPPPKK